MQSVLQSLRPQNAFFLPKRPCLPDGFPLSKTESGIVDNIATAAHMKLLTRSLSPFCVIAIHSHSLVNDEHGIHKTVLIDRALDVPQIANLNTDERSAHLSRRIVYKNTGPKISNLPTDTAQRKSMQNKANTGIVEQAKTKNAQANPPTMKF